jgi:hypothetical protein
VINIAQILVDELAVVRNETCIKTNNKDLCPMARFNEALTSSESKTGLLSHLRLHFAVLLMAVVQIPLSSQAYAEP